jgi:hypothetical protein
MDKQVRQAYIDLIDKIQVDSDMKGPIIDFIQTYDGTNTNDLKFLVLSLIFILNKFGELEIKAAAFDAISENNEDYKAELAALKQEYNNFMENQLPPSQPKINVAE